MTAHATDGAPPLQEPYGPLATYVFAVCRAGAATEPPRAAGLSGNPLRLLPLGAELAAVVQSVPASEYAEEAWKRLLGEPASLERCARAHHEAVTATAACATAVPLPLATQYEDDLRAREALTEQTSRFDEALRRVEGREEWGVKVYVAAGREAPQDPPAAVPSAPPSPAPGAGLAYLNRRRAEHDGWERRREESVRQAERVDTALRTLAVAARRLRPHESEVKGERRQVLNASYLVDGTDTALLHRTVEGLRRRTGAEIELTGPWVPYSFAGADA
ncbi:GvpL/GvpF family gas vesicle protein [Streptomyces tsukubensis]|uniref:Gas vesicle protein n=1 Tax=Streptomyces tsukubensis TaxID=83656 RepID=A0A1V4AGD0_9ACTN|nr:GvpL/GvpF family gas vesicle protein [Streptomyces tsukubensis]OON82661.1 hypothetical protein B1H18_00940 [Streptomyces tsukubensis]QFR92169.1 gas vesicle protein [Streptomyces tsukubensis]